jgi:hypothetical protein
LEGGATVERAVEDNQMGDTGSKDEMASFTPLVGFRVERRWNDGSGRLAVRRLAMGEPLAGDGDRGKRRRPVDVVHRGRRAIDELKKR